MDEAAKRGDLEKLIKLHGDPVGTVMCTYEAMTNAAKRGDLEIMHWLHEHRSEYLSNLTEVLIAAAEVDQVEVLEWLTQHFDLVKSAKAAYKTAFRAQKFNAMRWLLKHFREPISHPEVVGTRDVMRAPLDIVQLACDVHQLPICLELACTAARCGNLKAVRWLVNLDNRKVARTLGNREALLLAAIESDHLDMVQWCEETLQCRSSLTLLTAAKLGNLPMTKYRFEKDPERAE